MKTFLVLYNAPQEVMNKWREASPEDQKKGMDAWKEWGEKYKDNLVDFGNPVGSNTRITADDATPTPNEIGGYSIFKAESTEAATKILQDNPHFSEAGGYIELMEIVSME